MYTASIEKTFNTVFFLISGHLFSTPDKSNLFQFLLKVRVIGNRLYFPKRRHNVIIRSSDNATFKPVRPWHNGKVVLKTLKLRESVLMYNVILTNSGGWMKKLISHKGFIPMAIHVELHNSKARSPAIGISVHPRSSRKVRHV